MTEVPSYSNFIKSKNRSWKNGLKNDPTMFYLQEIHLNPKTQIYHK